MSDFDQIMPITEVKRRLLELLKQLQETSGTIAITKNGVPAGVLMSMDDYDSLLETIEILTNPDTLEALRASARDLRAGRVASHREVWK